MSVIYCNKCHRLVTTVAHTEEGLKIGNINLGKNGQIKGGLTMKCPAGHAVKVIRGEDKVENNDMRAKMLTSRLEGLDRQLTMMREHKSQMEKQQAEMLDRMQEQIDKIQAEKTTTQAEIQTLNKVIV